MDLLAGGELMFVDVRGFVACPGGVSDSRDAIQAAVDHAVGGQDRGNSPASTASGATHYSRNKE